MNCPRCNAKSAYDDQLEVPPYLWNCGSVVYGDGVFSESHACLKKQKNLMLAVLKWYANEENWKELNTGIGMMDGPAVQDGGKHAKELVDFILQSEKKD